MNNNDQDNDILDKAKNGMKQVLSLASSPIKKYILTGILTVLPYVVVGVLVVVLVTAVVLGVSEQLDKIYDETGKIAEDFGERLSHAITLQGFRNNEELEADEETDYFRRLKIFELMYNLSNYDITLINQTLLYEGNAEDRTHLSYNESIIDDFFSLVIDGNIAKEDQSDEEFKTEEQNKEEQQQGLWGGVLEGLTGFNNAQTLIDAFGGLLLKKNTIAIEIFKNIAIRYTIGFLNGIAGASQYEKASKSLYPTATAILKCKELTGDDGIKKPGTNMVVNMGENFKTCYKGFLVAEDSKYMDFFAENGISFVEEGELVYNNDFVRKFFKSVVDILFWRSWLLPTAPLKFAFSIYSMGCLSGEGDCPSDLYHYNGYIYQNLQEYYKYDIKMGDNVGKTEDEKTKEENIDFNALTEEEIDALVERYEFENKNKHDIAQSIIDMTDGYFDLTYGQVEAGEKASYRPPQGLEDIVTGTSCSGIPKEDLPYFSSPTSNCSVNSCFGVYGGNWGCKPHKGIDVNASSGIYSICDGVVENSGMYNDGSASFVHVRCTINGKNYLVRYLHMPLNYVNNWHNGSHVNAGDFLGEQGAVGSGVSGAHLHLDISLNGSYVNPEALVSNCNFNVSCDSDREVCGKYGNYYCK